MGEQSKRLISDIRAVRSGTAAQIIAYRRSFRAMLGPDGKIDLRVLHSIVKDQFLRNKVDKPTYKTLRRRGLELKAFALRPLQCTAYEVIMGLDDHLADVQDQARRRYKLYLRAALELKKEERAHDRRRKANQTFARR